MCRVVDGDQAWGPGDRERAVVDPHPPERVERDAEQVAEVDADHAAMRDDEDVVAISMVRADPSDSPENPRADVRERLAPGRRAIQRRPDPREVRIALPRADFVDRAPFPFAER